jgi:HlyD family type I secretion membrane fusion protein
MSTLLLEDGTTERRPAEIPDAPPLRGSAIWLLVVILVAFGGFGGWAAVARLRSAAVAPAVIAVESSRKTVQHPDGGIVRRLLVREGDTVQANQLLIELDDVQMRSKLTANRQQHWAALARQARFQAEFAGDPAVAFPAALLEARAAPQVDELIQQQNELFSSRRTSYLGKHSILERQVAQSRQNIAAMGAQLQSSIEQQRLIQAEIADVRLLLDKGLATRPRLLALQRSAADLKGRQGELEGSIARVQQEVAGRELDIVDLDNQRRSDAARELETVQRELGDLAQQVASTADLVQRSEIRAPVAGRVIGLQMVTLGGVVRAGDPILDIVPRNDELIAEARVQPGDIDTVYVGLPAEIYLLAYKQRDVPSIGATVFHLSADRLTDPRTGDSYYLARLRIDAAELARFEAVQLTPGMPAEALIITGERTALEYFLTPIMAGLRRAFREE